MTIYIESRVCEELGISYDSPGTESTIDKEQFIEAWELLCITKEWITTREDIPKDLPSSRDKFSEFIAKQTKDKMNLINKGSGYFEVT